MGTRSWIIRNKDTEFNPEYVRDISVNVYMQRLTLSGHKAVEKMLASDADGGKKLRNRAGAYDDLVRCFLRAVAEVPLG